MPWGPCRHADSSGMFLRARDTWWASKAHTNRKKSWGLWGKWSSLIKLATSPAGACLDAPLSLEGFQGCAEAKTHCYRDPLLQKGPTGARSDSWEQCA